MKGFIYVLFAALLSACTTLGVPVSEAEAKKYASISEFLYGNFTSVTQAYRQDRDDAAQNGVKWEAPFSGLNNSYISKPRNDLETFCRSKGGAFKVEFIPDGTAWKKFGDRYRRNELAPPLTHAMQAAHFAASRGAPEDVIKMTFENAFDSRTREIKSTSNPYSTIISGVEYAESNSLIGQYICEGGASGNWRAIIDIINAKHEYGSPWLIMNILGFSLTPATENAGLGQ
ncbi:MAG: hypothetical protein ACK4E7_04605 [Permianibacter sp.]